MEKNERNCRAAVEQMDNEEAKKRLLYLASILDGGEMPRISTYDLIFFQPEVWRDDDVV